MRNLIIIFTFLLLADMSYSKSYGLRESDKDWDFNFTLELNYMAVDHNAYIQLVGIPEITFGKQNIGLGFYFPFSFNRYYEIRQIEYNSTEAFISKLYYFQWGRKDKNPYFIKIAAIEDFTLGQGLLIQRYNNTMTQPEIRKLGVISRVKYKGIQFEGIMGDIFTQSVTGGRISVHLGDLLGTKKGILSTFEIGVSLISDFTPKRLNTVYVSNRYDHKITVNSDSSDSVFGYSVDLSMYFIRSSIIDFGAHAEFAKLSISGEGIAYGIQAAVSPEIVDLKFKFQMRHLMNSFEASYYNSFYDIYRSYKIDSSPNTSGNTGWYAEMSGLFYKKRLGFTLAYDEVINGSSRPHLYFKYFMQAIPKSLFLTIQYDQYSLGDQGILSLENLNSYFLFEALIRFNRYMEFGFSFRKGFIIENSGSELLKNLNTYTIHTKLMF